MIQAIIKFPCRLIGRTCDFESHNSGSKPDEGTNLIRLHGCGHSLMVKPSDVTRVDVDSSSTGHPHAIYIWRCNMKCSNCGGSKFYKGETNGYYHCETCFYVEYQFSNLIDQGGNKIAVDVSYLSNESEVQQNHLREVVVDDSTPIVDFQENLRPQLLEDIYFTDEIEDN